MAQLLNKLPLLAKNFELYAIKAHNETADWIRKRTYELSPVDTGALRESYRVEADDNKSVIGSPLEYSVYQEFGTSKMGAQPHLYPAYEEGKAVLQGKIRKYLREATKKTGGV